MYDWGSALGQLKASNTTPTAQTLTFYLRAQNRDLFKTKYGTWCQFSTLEEARS